MQGRARWLRGVHRQLAQENGWRETDVHVEILEGPDDAPDSSTGGGAPRPRPPATQQHGGGDAAAATDEPEPNSQPMFGRLSAPARGRACTKFPSRRGA